MLLNVTVGFTCSLQLRFIDSVIIWTFDPPAVNAHSPSAQILGGISLKCYLIYYVSNMMRSHLVYMNLTGGVPTALVSILCGLKMKNNFQMLAHRSPDTYIQYSWTHTLYSTHKSYFLIFFMHCVLHVSLSVIAYLNFDLLFMM